MLGIGGHSSRICRHPKSKPATKGKSSSTWFCYKMPFIAARQLCSLNSACVTSSPKEKRQLYLDVYLILPSYLPDTNVILLPICTQIFIDFSIPQTLSFILTTHICQIKRQQAKATQKPVTKGKPMQVFALSPAI